MNPSLRTRISTEKAGRNLGMDVQVLNGSADAWALEFEDGAVMDRSQVEHIRDAAAVMGRYFDIMGLRSFPSLKDRNADYSEKVFHSFAKHANVPFLSMESATRHPLQSLADMATIRQHSTTPQPKVVLTWAPHVKPLPQAVANSFAEWALAAGHNLTIAHPPGFDLAPDFTQGAKVEHNQAKALEGADFVYVKNWSAYEDYGRVLESAQDWMLTEAKLAAAPNAWVMHCLPVRRNVELPDQILDGPRALMQLQAENRLYAAQAVLRRMLLAL
jgi:N-succinyl-L-ornithine transcarbamylase